jgi:hypothetical protein
VLNLSLDLADFIGDVTLPCHSGAATHGLVFMLGSVATRWKQTVAYYFTSNATDGSVLTDIVAEKSVWCHEIKLNVAAVTSDVSSLNRAMWKSWYSMSYVMFSSCEKLAQSLCKRPCSHTASSCCEALFIAQ